MLNLCALVGCEGEICEMEWLGCKTGTSGIKRVGERGVRRTMWQSSIGMNPSHANNSSSLEGAEGASIAASKDDVPLIGCLGCNVNTKNKMEPL